MNKINRLFIGAALAGAAVVPAQAQYYGGSGYHHFGPHHSYSIGVNDAANLIGAVGALIHGGPSVVYQPAPPIFYQPAPVIIYTPNGPITMPRAQIPGYGYGQYW